MEQNKSDLQVLEEERKKIVSKQNLCYGLAVLLIGVAILFFFFQREWSFVLSFMLFLIGIVLISVTTSTVNRFSKKFKTSVVEEMIKEELGNSAVYRRNGGIAIDEINRLRVARCPDRFTSEDYIQAVYADVPFEICDYTMQQRVVTRTAKGQQVVSYQTYFKGRIIKIQLKRKLDMALRIVNEAPSGFDRLGLDSFETEVIDFNQRFKCYASDQEKAFYVLTPLLIQKMLELEKMYSGGMCFILQDNCFYVWINDSKDSLEVNIRKPIDQAQLARFRSEILLAPSIINEFDLDSDKFNKDIRI